MSSRIPAAGPGRALVPPPRALPSAATDALGPVDPVAAPDRGAARTLLAGSGIDLAALLADGDTLVERAPQSRVALAALLESARGALVRNAPADVLALLDEGWDSAQHTEHGWYLRSSALAMLGLPGEALRILRDAGARQRSSTALRFLRSVVHLLLDDVDGSRVAIDEALTDQPDAPLLRAHRAIVLAHAHDAEGAQRELLRAAADAPDHPALAYARHWIADWRLVHMRNAHAAARPVDVTAAAPASVSASASESAAPAFSDDVAVETTRAARSPHADPLDALVHDVGMRLIRDPVDECVHHIRAVLRALTSGGSLGAIATSERVHAARALLASIASSLERMHGGFAHLAASAQTHAFRGAPRRMSGELDGLVRELVHALRNGDARARSRLLLQAERDVTAGMRALLTILADGAQPAERVRETTGAAAALHPADAAGADAGATTAPDAIASPPASPPASPSRATVSTPVSVQVFVDRAREAAHHGVVGPVRLGLALLGDDATAIAAATIDAAARHGATQPIDPVDSFQRSHGIAQTGGAPRRAVTAITASMDDGISTHRRGAWRIAGTVLCGVGTIAAAFAGAPYVALALAAATAWSIVRHSDSAA